MAVCEFTSENIVITNAYDWSLSIYASSGSFIQSDCEFLGGIWTPDPPTAVLQNSFSIPVCSGQLTFTGQTLNCSNGVWSVIQPLHLQTGDGALLAGAFLSVWCVAWGFRFVVNFINDHRRIKTMSKKILIVTTAVAASLVAGPTFALTAFETAAATLQADAGAAVTAIGGAIMGVAVIAASFKWAKAALFG